jgi:hypothetical protein
MADGSTRPIETIREGDWVLSFDLETGQSLPAKVRQLEVHPNTPEFLSVNDGRLITTPEHALYINGKVAAARELRVGDTLLLYDRERGSLSPSPVRSVEPLRGSRTSYNVLLVGPGGYIVAGYYGLPIKLKR